MASSNPSFRRPRVPNSDAKTLLGNWQEERAQSSREAVRDERSQSERDELGGVQWPQYTHPTVVKEAAPLRAALTEQQLRLQAEQEVEEELRARQEVTVDRDDVMNSMYHVTHRAGGFQPRDLADGPPGGLSLVEDKPITVWSHLGTTAHGVTRQADVVPGEDKPTLPVNDFKKNATFSTDCREYIKNTPYDTLH